MTIAKLFPLIIVLSTLFLVTTPARADYLLDQSGYLIKLDALILGDSDENESELESDTQNSQRVDQQTERLRESEQKAFEQKREQSQKQQEKQREVAKQKLERQLEQNKKKIKTNVETKIRNTDGQLRIKQSEEMPGGRTKETEIELSDNESLHIEDEDGTLTEVKRPEKPNVSVVNNELELKKNRIKARTDLELKVGEKNEITVTLPNGKEKEIKIPDQALENLITKGIIIPAEGNDTAYELTAGKDGNPVYQTEAQVEKKIFGLFKMKVAQKIEVAASDSEDGSVIAGDIVSSENAESNPLRRFFSRFAF